MTTKCGIIGGRQDTITSIRLLQLNLQHSKLAQINLNNWIDKHKQDNYICLCQEPYIYKANASMQPRTSSKYIGGQGSTPRTAIYTSPTIKAWFIEELSNRDITVIVIKLNKRETMIVSGYLDFEKQVIQDWLKNVMSFANNRGYAILMGLDSKCHSELYGLETNKRGEILEDFIGEHKLKVENQGKTPTYQSSRGRSIIDITLTAKLAVTVKNWRVDTSINFSDHNTIKYEIEADIVPAEPSRNWTRINWADFRHTLDKTQIRIQDNMTPHRLDKCLGQWYTQINNALDKCCPKKRMKPKDLNNPWWTDALQQQRKNLKGIHKAHQANPTAALKTKLKQKQKGYKKACLDAKHKDWQNFNTNQNSLESINTLRRILEKKKHNSLGVLVKPDGTITNPGAETLKYLMEAHFPTITEVAETEYSNQVIQTSRINATNIDGFDMDKLKEVINTFKNKKSAGLDGIKPHTKLSELLFIYKAMLLLNFTPTEWTKSKIIWIPKSGKDTYKVFKSWRPISLLNQSIKVMEKLIVKQADIDMTPVHSRQHGFRKNRSTKSAISETVEYIEEHMTRNEFLDIQAAFDTIKPKTICDSLIQST